MFFFTASVGQLLSSNLSNEPYDLQSEQTFSFAAFNVGLSNLRSMGHHWHRNPQNLLHDVSDLIECF